MEVDFKKGSYPLLSVKPNHGNKFWYCSYPTNFSEHRKYNFNTKTLCPQVSTFEGTTSLSSFPSSSLGMLLSNVKYSSLFH